jgi:hypothetical protein
MRDFFNQVFSGGIKPDSALIGGGSGLLTLNFLDGFGEINPEITIIRFAFACMSAMVFALLAEFMKYWFHHYIKPKLRKKEH